MHHVPTPLTCRRLNRSQESTSWRFNSFQAVVPSPHSRLAHDPGVQALLARYQWNIGALTEMPPEGTVGTSPVCILGVNINRGQEISLRIRTGNRRATRVFSLYFGLSAQSKLSQLSHLAFGTYFVSRIASNRHSLPTNGLGRAHTPGKHGATEGNV